MSLFKKTTPTPSEPVMYPSGVFIHTEEGYFFIVSPTKRYRLVSKRVLDSWSPQRVIETSEATVVNYNVVAKLKFRNGSLIHNLADGNIYLISDGKRRQILTSEGISRIGAVPKEIVTVSDEEMNLHELGDVIA